MALEFNPHPHLHWQRLAPTVTLLIAVACSTSNGKATNDLQKVLDSARLDVQAPGAILGVRFPNDNTVVVASGLSDIETRRVIQSGDAFFLGSVSKTFTATVVMRLVEEGTLSLSDPLSRFLPAFPRGEDITIRHLLHHTSGLRDFYVYLYFRPDRAEMIELVTKDWTQQELLELAARFGHSFDPGEDWAYSSTNYFLLGVVVERVTGRTLAESYREFIFERLGLQETWLAIHEAEKASLRITGYLSQTDVWEHSEMFGEMGATTVLDRSPVEWGAGGLAAPVKDVLAFMDALMTHKIVSNQSVATMLEFRPTPSLGTGGVSPDIASAYGLGLVRMQRQNYTIVGHGGLFTGHTAGVWYIPSCGVTVGLFFNRGFVGQRRALDRVIPAITQMNPSLAECTD